MLTDTKPNRQTVALRLTANVRSHPVEISLAEIQEAVAPNYFDPKEIVDIDLTGIPDLATAAYWTTAAGTIKEKVARLYDRPGPVDNISVFALAPIPLLIFLGAQLSNKIRTAFFQRHRDPQTWTWKEGPSTATYSWTRQREGTNPKKVAVIFSLSGRVHLSDLPDQVDEQFTIYELALDSTEPSPYFLNTTGDLTRFRAVYNDAIRSLNATHEGITALHLFPAVPAPVAVAMGWELLPKRDPTLLVYDYDNQGGGFRPTLEVNPHDR